jgi:hypothetical protein
VPIKSCPRRRASSLLKAITSLTLGEKLSSIGSFLKATLKARPKGLFAVTPAKQMPDFDRLSKWMKFILNIKIYLGIVINGKAPDYC